MLGKSSSLMLLTLMLIGVSVLLFNTQLTKASGTIYIRADGSFDPPTAPISSVDNITYIFTDNIYDEIIVERDNITLDGLGYTLQGTAAGYGIWLIERINVTIKNFKIKGFNDGIRLDLSSNNNISGNNITGNNGYGILLVQSSSNTISENNVTYNEHGIRLYKSSRNTISGNNITANDRYGIRLYTSSNYNIISQNNITKNLYGINLSNSSNSLTSGNTISHNAEYGVASDGYGIGLESHSTNNTIFRNAVAANWVGILFGSSRNNTVFGNDVTANRWVGIQLSSSWNNTISRNNIRANSGFGIYLSYSDYNNISINEVTDNDYGIMLSSSSDHNNVFGNNVTAHNRHSYSFAFRLWWSEDNNIHRNNFAENSDQVLSDVRYGNIWDDSYPNGGNYWSDYNGTDLYSGPYQNLTESDGIGDTAYVIDANNTDHYPLMKPYSGAYDIGVKVHISRAVVPEGYRGATNISVTIINYGVQTAHVNVTCQTTTTTYEELFVVAGRGSTTMVFPWNTTDLSKGNYTVTVLAEPVPGETCKIDNYCTHWIIVAIVGDITGPDGWPDGKCDMSDIGLVARGFAANRVVNRADPRYGEYWHSTPCDVCPHSSNCDVIYDGRIDMKDIGTVARHFGETDP